MCFTDDDKIYRVELLTGRAADILWRPAIVKPNSGVPGSNVSISGVGFPYLTSPPENRPAWEFGGTRVFIGGYPTPILDSNFYGLTVQAPWGLSTLAGQRVPILIDSGNGYLVDGSFDVLPPQIVFEKNYLGEVLSTRQGTNLEVGTDAPLLPGDIVAMKVTGLGPVNVTVPTGEVSPTGPYAHTILPVTCGTGTSFDSLDVYFSGLAPNEVGTYRIVMKVPVDAKASYRTAGGDSFDFDFHCTLGNDRSAGGLLNVKLAK